MHVIPAHRPVVIVSCLRETRLCIIKITAVIGCDIEPASCPRKFVVESAPGIVETICCRITGITSGRIRKCIEALCMLKTCCSICRVVIFENDCCNSHRSSSFAYNRRTRIILRNAVRRSVHAHYFARTPPRVISAAVTYLIVEDFIFRVTLDEIIRNPLDIPQDIFELTALFICSPVFVK